MPNKPQGYCVEPHCNRRTNRRRCKACEQARDRARGTAAERGYGAKWQKERAAFLKANPWCSGYGLVGERVFGEIVAERPCYNLATVVDHIIRKNKGGTDDMDNLQGLCEECHNRKRADESRGL